MAGSTQWQTRTFPWKLRTEDLNAKQLPAIYLSFFLFVCLFGFFLDQLSNVLLLLVVVCCLGSLPGRCT